MNLNVCEWKSFYLKDLFDIRMGDKLDKNKMSQDCPSVNFVSRISYNNGVDIKVDLIEGKQPNRAGLLTVSLGGEYLGSCYIQKEPFYTAQNVAIMEPRVSQMSFFVNLFICALVKFECQTKYYAFGRELNTHINTDFEIILPVKHNFDGSLFIDTQKDFSEYGYVPDWRFMEDYVKSLHHKPLTTKNHTQSPTKINIEDWEPFTVNKLFTKLEEGKANQGMLKDGNDCFYIGAKRDDNGVMFRCQRDESLLQKGNCIIFICNGEGSVGYANYMDREFIGTADIVAGYNPNLNSYNGIFLATIFSQERPKFSFGRKWKPRLKETTIKLPILRNSDGEPIIDKNREYSENGYVPDWLFMENYIKSLSYGDRI